MSRTERGVEVLTEAECRRLLERQQLGRVVVTDGELITVSPVNYGMVGGDIVVFTAPETKLAAADGRRVTFEIDEFDLAQESGWSVLVTGTATAGDLALRQRAEAIGVYPWPGGERHHVVRIRPEHITGRRVAAGRRPPMERRRGTDRRANETATGQPTP